MKTNLKKTAAFLCIIIGGLGFISAILDWMGSNRVRNWGNGVGFTGADASYIFSSIIAPAACVLLIVFGVLMMLGILKGRAFDIIIIVATAVSSIWFANLLQQILAGAVIIFFVYDLFGSEKQADENEAEELNDESEKKPTKAKISPEKQADDEGEKKPVKKAPAKTPKSE